MTPKISCRVVPLLLAAGLAAAMPAQAAPTTLVGARFDVVYEPSSTGLLGAPRLDGDRIVFTPTGFRAESLDGFGEVINEQVFSLQLILHPGQALSALQLTEQGSYRLSGKQSDVSVSGELRADISGLPGLGLAQAISPVGYFRPGDGSALPWSAISELDFSAVPVALQASGITLNLQNVLQGFTRKSDVGTRIASIDATGDLVLSASVVPEPTSGVLLLLGLAAVGLGVRRSRMGAKGTRS
jgi:hypothetical protein